MKSYASVQSSILRRISCSTLVQQQTKRPAAKIDENCDHKICAPRGARSTKKKKYYILYLIQIKSSSSSSSLHTKSPRSALKIGTLHGSLNLLGMRMPPIYSRASFYSFLSFLPFFLFFFVSFMRLHAGKMRAKCGQNAGKGGQRRAKAAKSS